MHVNELIKAPLNTLSNGYWTICNSDDGFDRDVITAADMQHRERGNCFTLSEFLCDKLVNVVGIDAAGICIEVLSNRKNYHAATWAISRNEEIFRFDLLKPTPIPQPQLRQASRQLLSLENSNDKVLYVSTKLQPGLTAVTATASRIDETYNWPSEGNCREAVFLSKSLGIQVLHKLAELGGTNHLLSEESRASVMGLPVLPRQFE